MQTMGTQQRAGTERRFDRTVEDLGNVVMLEHINVRVPDQHLATLFYVTGLGLTRDPYLMTGVNNMWINIGKSQCHLPTGKPQVIRGVTGLVIPGRQALVQRLAGVKDALAGTQFSCREAAECIEVTCPWGNRFRIHEPGPRFGKMRLGMPYVELEVPRGTAEGIARFYHDVLDTPARVQMAGGTAAAHVSVGADQELVYREADNVHPDYDGHHVAIYLVDFSRPWKKLIELGLVTEESDQHQYRFQDIIDPATRKVLFTLEHEVRSMRHPLYARYQVNRNPAQSNRAFAPGYEEVSWALPAAT
ncbi:MAG: hypothetical protein AB7O57_11075 [Hyphomicrobiaceae bacterium]